MQFIYNIGILLFTAITYIFSPFNDKASLWIRGRIGWKRKLADKIIPGQKYLWIHCASLGEFEQGRPVIEALKSEKKDLKIILTFFSPSGYEIRKNYEHADIVFYLPADTRANAIAFIGIVNPVAVIFVKYEFWHNYISEIYRKQIPLYLISGIFRPEQHFFRWYGSFFRKMLMKFTRIFVQDQKSLELLHGIGISEAVIAGDTRFDRVRQIASAAKDIDEIEQFRGSEKLFIAGSSWSADEEIITRYINSFPGKMKWIFAPHEIDNQNLSRLEKLLEVKTVRFSQHGDLSGSRVMIIDNIGLLSSAYRYAYIAAIGGGFGKGIHNILEPACWGIPVMFGPRYEKFREAVELINENGAASYDSYESFSATLDNWLANEEKYRTSARRSASYVAKNVGATGIIMNEIRMKLNSYFNVTKNETDSLTYLTKA